MGTEVKRIAVSDFPAEGLAGLIQAGPFLFTSGCDGHRDPESRRIRPELAAEAERQCEIAYGEIGRLLRLAGADLSSVVRLDHVTSSQDWLPRRQTVRQALFGRPAPLVSTGIAAKMDGINMVSASAIAVVDPALKQVLVPGPHYGMNNISSVVRGGPLLFMSGIRATHDPRTNEEIPEETAGSFAIQTRRAYEIIRSMLEEVGARPDALLRIDSFIREAGKARLEVEIRREVLGDIPCAATVTALPLSARGEVEITALALAPGEPKRVVTGGREGLQLAVVEGGGFVFIGECRPDIGDTIRGFEPALLGIPERQLEAALSVLEAALREAGSALARCVRLDLYLKDIYFAGEAQKILRRRFAGSPPTLCVIGAELEPLCEVKLSAIAV